MKSECRICKFAEERSPKSKKGDSPKRPSPSQSSTPKAPKRAAPSRRLPLNLSAAAKKSKKDFPDSATFLDSDDDDNDKSGDVPSTQPLFAAEDDE